MAGRKTIEKLARQKGLVLNFRYRYELRDGHNVVYWAYFLSDVENYLKGYIHA